MATRAQREAAEAEEREQAQEAERAEQERKEREAVEQAERDKAAEAERARIAAEAEQRDQQQANAQGQQATTNAQTGTPGAQASADTQAKERGTAEAATNGDSPASAMKPTQQSEPGQVMDGDGTRHGVGNAGEGGIVAASDVGSAPTLATAGSIADMAAHRYNDPAVGGSFAPVPAETTGDARTDLKPLTQPVQRLVPVEDHGEIPPVLATANLPAGSEPRNVDVGSGRDIVR